MYSTNNYTFLIAIVLIFMHNITDSRDLHSYQESKYLRKADNELELKATKRYERDLDGTCKIPENAPYNIFKSIGKLESKYKFGEYVPSYTALEIVCHIGYKLPPLAQNISFCVNRVWTPQLSKCIRACPSLTSIRSTKVQCSHGAVPLDNCFDPVEGTTVYLTCNALYEKPIVQNNPIHLCTDGKWEPPILECNPMCGEKHPSGVTNIINGENVEIGDYPWHMGIYNSMNMEYLCGGSLIYPNIILSAAHCFTDIEGTAFPSINYMVAGGKYHRQLIDARDSLAQYNQIKELIISPKYHGRVTVQAFDIAVLILNTPFLLSVAVQPVCIDLNEDFTQLTSFLSGSGIVTGWGFTQELGVPSDVLKEVTIPYVPFDKCFDEIPICFRKYFTPDKICGGYLNSGTGVCSGDSGGGYVFNKATVNKYYIKGVVSTSPATNKSQCDSNQYSLYTSIAAHIEFVQNITVHNRLRDHLECKYDRCENIEVEDENQILESDVLCCSSSQSPVNCYKNYAIRQPPAECSGVTHTNEETEMSASCRLPNNPEHGRYLLNNETYEPGRSVRQTSMLTLTCDPGYIASTSNTTQFNCINNGQWTPTPGICVVAEVSPSTTEPPEIQMKISQGGDKSRQKCQEYGKYIYEHSDPKLHAGSNSPHNKSICTIENAESVGLSIAKPNEFPHMVAIGYDYNDNKIAWKCGGALISEKFVLTASQCSYYTTTGPARYALLGVNSLNPNEYGSHHQQIPIKRRIVHPDRKYPLLYNDIALFELERNAILNSYVRPACLNTNPIIRNEVAILSGWPQITYNLRSNNFQLKKSVLNMYTPKECNKTYATNTGNVLSSSGIDEEIQICAGSKYKAEAEICKSIGPLHIVNSEEVNCTYSIIGLNSISQKCGTQNYPRVYTKVSAYIKWIEDTIWP